MIRLENISLARGNKRLLEQASAMIHRGDKIGIIGNNGTGKSSLFQLLSGHLSCDQGEYERQGHYRLIEIEQQIPHGQEKAIDYVLAGHQQLANIQQQLQIAESNNDGVKIAELHQALLEIDAYQLSNQAAKIMDGLGFKQAQLNQAIDAFSGGWRIRLNLARMLIQPADLYLLDEPTNHLDLEAIFWLEKWIKDLNSTVMIISHDREFLDQTVKRIIFLNNQKLTSYGGNYSQFEKQYVAQLAIQQKTFLKQQQQISHLQSFVDRFRYKSSKAKQAQSRLKMIERMDKVAAIQQVSPFSFSFKPAPAAEQPMLKFDHIDIGYDDKIILNNVNFSLYPQDRIALIGENGAGKSTLVKAMAKKLAIKGRHFISSKLKMAYFTQHQIESLSLDQHPLWHLKKIDGDISEKNARQFLGSFNFQGSRVFEAVKNFSGGEKARLALALLIWQQPNLLLLDEPSNHLDLETRQALSYALQQYNGALILITHDRHLLNSVVDQFYLVADQRLQAFDGDLSDYQQWLMKRKTADKPKPGKKATKKIIADNSNSDLKKIEKLEVQLANKQQHLSAIEAALSEPALYQDKQKQAQLLEHQQQQQSLSVEIEQLEHEILVLIDKC